MGVQRNLQKKPIHSLKRDVKSDDQGQGIIALRN